MEVLYPVLGLNLVVDIAAMRSCVAQKRWYFFHAIQRAGLRIKTSIAGFDSVVISGTEYITDIHWDTSTNKASFSAASFRKARLLFD